MGRLVARGKYLYDGERKFFARGVSYGPFAANSRGERYPEPERAGADFALMREMGANLVRVYVPPPPWLFELAAKHELKLMVGMPWPFHMAFLDSHEMTRDIRNTIRDGVTAMRHWGDTIAAYSIGNEVRSDIVRWHGPRAVNSFLHELYDLGKQIDPDGLFTYSNYPSAEYIDLSFLDVISFNVYLHREADFRRYLTHLMGVAGERPLILSETGMDTIREGEDHQAELLSWQMRAAFELGLAGSIIFAFTDEWHTGGAEITDWAFGLVTRDRIRKRAFAAVGEIFRAVLPPPLLDPPKASVVVAAYNAETTIRGCLNSLARINYPDYEVIVVDDGSTDATAKIAADSGVRTLQLEHRGLSAARNAGIEAANGRIVAFIDADAEADSDWLYHLTETITRTRAAAAGGPNFPPTPPSAIGEAIAAAPGEPREVRMGADELAQLCGCNMAVDRAAAGGDALFDPAFTQAGDDVDLSWRLRERGLKLAYAPAAVVTHERRRTIRGYIRQQRGYGRAEGLLFRKYPRHDNAREGLYGGSGWTASWLRAGPRVYYGAFGRGLFQTIYPGAALPRAAEIPLTAQWIGVAIILIIGGAFSRFFGILGVVGLIISILSACAGALMAPAAKPIRRRSRVILAMLWFLGPALRSYERARVAWAFRPDTRRDNAGRARGLRGRIALTSLRGADAGAAISPAIPSDGAAGDRADGAQTGNHANEAERAIGGMRDALVRRGAAVALSDGYEPYDLEMIVAPALRVPIMLLQQDGETAIGWRVRIEPLRLGLAAAVIFVMLLLAGLSLTPAVAVIVILAILTLAIIILRSRKIAALIAAAAADIASKIGLRSAHASEV